MNPTRLVLPLLAAATLLVAGCASTPDYNAKSAYAKALPYPDRLAPSKDVPGALSWTKPGNDFSRYHSLLIERIAVQLDPASSAVDPSDLKALTDYFRQAIVKALQPPYTVTDKTGPGVLRMRLVLVDLMATNTAMSVVVLATPYATLPDMIAGEASGNGPGAAPYLGRTAIAATFIDGETNEVVAEYADTNFGQKYVLDTNQGATAAVQTGIDQYLNAYSTWAYAKEAFDNWAKYLRSRFDVWNLARKDVKTP